MVANTGNYTEIDPYTQTSRQLSYGPNTPADRLQLNYAMYVKAVAAEVHKGNARMIGDKEVITPGEGQVVDILDRYANHIRALEQGKTGQLMSFEAFAATQTDIWEDHTKQASAFLKADQSVSRLAPLVFKDGPTVAYQPTVLSEADLAHKADMQEQQRRADAGAKAKAIWIRSQTKAEQFFKQRGGHSWVVAEHKGDMYAMAEQLAMAEMVSEQSRNPQFAKYAPEMMLYAQRHAASQKAQAYLAVGETGKGNEAVASIQGINEQLVALKQGGGTDAGTGVASTGHGGPAGGGFMNAAYNAVNGGSKGFGGMVKEYGQWGGALLGAIVGGMFGGGGFLGIFIGALLGIALGNGFKEQIGGFIDSKFPAKPRTPGGNAPSRGAGRGNATLVSHEAPAVVTEPTKSVGMVVQGQDNALLDVTENGNLVAGVTHQKQLVMSNTGLPATITYTLEKTGESVVDGKTVDKAQMKITGLSVDGVAVPQDKLTNLRLPVDGNNVDLSSLSGLLESHTALAVVPGKVAKIESDITSGMSAEQKSAQLSTAESQAVSFDYRHAFKNASYAQLPVKGELKQDGDSWTLTVTDHVIPQYYDVAGTRLPVDSTSLQLDKNGVEKPLTITGLSAPTEGQTMEDYLKANDTTIRAALEERLGAGKESPEKAPDLSGALVAGATPATPARTGAGMGA